MVRHVTLQEAQREMDEAFALFMHPDTKTTEAITAAFQDFLAKAEIYVLHRMEEEHANDTRGSGSATQGSGDQSQREPA
jgi:hypothetical protein